MWWQVLQYPVVLIAFLLSVAFTTALWIMVILKFRKRARKGPRNPK
jgi:hypothetical protein